MNRWMYRVGLLAVVMLVACGGGGHQGDQPTDGAESAVTLDSHDFDGYSVHGAAGWQTIRTIVYTPQANGLITLHGRIQAARVQGDSGYVLVYTIRAGEGVEETLHYVVSQSLEPDPKQFAFDAVRDVTAGVSLTIRVKASVYPGAPTPMVFQQSKLLVTASLS